MLLSGRLAQLPNPPLVPRQRPHERPQVVALDGNVDGALGGLERQVVKEVPASLRADGRDTVEHLAHEPLRQRVVPRREREGFPFEVAAGADQLWMLAVPLGKIGVGDVRAAERFDPSLRVRGR